MLYSWTESALNDHNKGILVESIVISCPRNGLIPNELYSLSNLTYIKIAHCPITTIPKELNTLTNLIVLEFGCCYNIDYSNVINIFSNRILYIRYSCWYKYKLMHIPSNPINNKALYIELT